ncbi:hypothetical protein KM427_08090 [Nocardioides sp. LMS-CY]|uniref:Uncharacterized protein n=1 Tax=Nocardioides soli TaxID=1036020 RepID=A0A7W4VSE8_9ACTN|nr:MULTISPECIES: hypothetical protein [Nocardioides]MBB3040942.1 hypothetical protein [Nocardioides soli]QWF23649.1 hypothetical protein KM427_08090 [Nocardioides sp. LMS-CY]
MGIIDLVDQSAATALEHAAELQDHLKTAGSGATMAECRAEMHRLVGDIVSLRNAAELLKRAQHAA